MYGSGYPAAVTAGSSPAASLSLPSGTTMPRPMGPMAIGPLTTAVAHGTLPAHAMSSTATQAAYWSPGDARRVVVSQQPAAQPVLRRSLGSSGAIQSSGCATAPSEMEKELSRRLDLCQEELVRERSKSEELAAELHEARLKSEDSEEIQNLRQQLAIRDRELVAAASARARCSERSEQLAASLRVKLTELEAHLAPPSPSASSSIASSRGLVIGGQAMSRAPGGPPAMERAHLANGFRGAPGLPSSEDSRKSSHRWRAAEVGTEEASPTGPLEFEQDVREASEQRLQVVTQALFEQCDERGCGTLSWKDGEVMKCLRQLLSAYRLPQPDLSPQTLLAIYSQVKEDNSDVEGLNLPQMCNFAQKVSEAAHRWEESCQEQQVRLPEETGGNQVQPTTWSWDPLASLDG